MVRGSQVVIGVSCGSYFGIVCLCRLIHSILLRGVGAATGVFLLGVLLDFYTTIGEGFIGWDSCSCRFFCGYNITFLLLQVHSMVQ